MSPVLAAPFRDRLGSLTFDRLTTAVFFLVVAAIACMMPIQTDTWWQLRGGQEFWQTGTVPLVESYSHTANGRFWMNHEWLSEAIFYAVYRLGGLPLLTLLAAGLATATVGVMWSLMRGPTLLRLALTGLSIGTISIAWTPRPHVFTLFLVAACARTMVRGRPGWLPPLFLVWANLHGGFTLGVGLLGAYWLSGLGDGPRRVVTRSVLVGVCLAMTLVTPLGVTFWLELPASLSRLQAYSVQEWQGPSPANVGVWPFWASLGALAWLGYRRGREMFAEPGDRLLTVASLLFIPLALTSLRNVPPFLVLCLPVLTRGWPVGTLPEPPVPSPRQARRHAAVLAGAVAIVVTIVTVAWSIPLPRLRWEPISTEVIAAVDSCEGALYNSYDDGGYLIWFAPHRPVFLDSRQDPYPVELIEQDIRAQFEADYREMFARYRVECALVRSGVPLDRQLQADGWQPLHRDRTWTVLDGP